MISFLLALTPLLLILVLMIGLRWSAARAGGAGYLCALGIAILFFGAGPELLAYAHAKALFLSLDVLLIIWSAFLLYRVVDEAGAIRTIGAALPHLTPDKGMQALIIGWIFASFLQGVGGFGVPVAVVAPLLSELGFTPLAAVLIPSLGHGWAVTFGSLGSSFQALLAATNQPDKLLTPPAAAFLGSAALLVGLQVAHAAGGWSAIRRLAWQVLLLGIVMGGVQYLVVTSGLWNIGAFIGSLAGLGVAFLLANRSADRPAVREQKAARQPVITQAQESNPQTEEPSSPKDPFAWRPLLVALSGYAVLIAITLGVQLIPAVKDILGRVVLQVNFPETRTALGFVTPAGPGRAIVIFRHTGTVLLYSSILAYLVYQRAGLYRPGAAGRILSSLLQRVMASSVSIASMLSMAEIMEDAGMTDVLARGLASSVGAAFPIISPWIGALGAFMTGSNTNSNVVFGALQMHTAELLGYSVPIILGAQTAGAALASVMAPAKVVVGASTAGMAGREGEVMRRLAGYAVLTVLWVSLLATLAVWLAGTK